MKTAILIFSLLMTSQAFSQAWVSTNTWDHRWERNYEHWVSQHWKDDVFISPKSHFKGITTDCADASYTMRIAFSYLRKLPFVIQDPSNPGVGKLSNNIRLKDNWIIKDLKRKLANEKRPKVKASLQHQIGKEKMKAFATYINTITTTRTMPRDTYPASMDPNGLAPGGTYVSPGSHSYQITNKNRYGILEISSSTLPRQQRYLSVEKNFPYYLPGDEKKDYSDGYRRFKWPQHINIKSLHNPLNTHAQKLDQFNIARNSDYINMRFNQIVARRLSKLIEPIGESAARARENLTNIIWERDNPVRDAQNHLWRIRSNGRRCMSRSEYDTHSTPSRDKRLLKNFESARTLVYNPRWKNNNEWSPSTLYIKRPFETLFLRKQLNPTLRSEVADLLRENVMGPDGVLTYKLKDWYPTGLNRIVDFIHIYDALKSGRLSYDPNSSVEARWGFAGHQKSGCKNY